MTHRSVPVPGVWSASEPPRICQPTVRATVTTIRLTPIVTCSHLARWADLSWDPGTRMPNSTASEQLVRVLEEAQHLDPLPVAPEAQEPQEGGQPGQEGPPVQGAVG